LLLHHLRLPAAYFQQKERVPRNEEPHGLAGAVAFGLFHGVVLTAVSAGMHCFVSEGGDMVNLISGLTDADAIALAGLTTLLI
jgi:uncharacterized membrane protein (DUF4010 family)